MQEITGYVPLFRQVRAYYLLQNCNIKFIKNTAIPTFHAKYFFLILFIFFGNLKNWIWASYQVGGQNEQIRTKINTWQTKFNAGSNARFHRNHKLDLYRNTAILHPFITQQQNRHLARFQLQMFELKLRARDFS
jgi:hypothetical protein